MIVEPQQRSTRRSRLSANRELAIGLVVLSILAALLLAYFMGYYCDEGSSWPCTPFFSSGEKTLDADSAPGEATGPVPSAPGAVPPPLVPSELFPPTATSVMPPTVLVPTAVRVTPTPRPSSTWVFTATSTAAVGTPTATQPTTATVPHGSATLPSGSPTVAPGRPTNTLMPGVTTTPLPTPPDGYDGPADPTATTPGYP